MKLLLPLVLLVARCTALVMPARPAAAVGRSPLLRSRPVVLQAAPESVAEDANGLPEGWAAAKDDEGSTYYWNKVRPEQSRA
tara:strand:+ start:142 stop:387 length:246 start_codon:yes stop_codon:yes gene_type:complete